MSSITARSYCPRSGSIPANVIAYFQKNLSAKFTGAEMAVKFGADPKNIGNILQLALDAGFIARSSGYYTAGDDIDEAPDYGSADQANATIAAARATSAAHSPFAHSFKASAPHKSDSIARSSPAPLPDPATIKLDNDIPVKPTRSVTDWAQLLGRMQTGQSAALPTSAKSTLAKAVGEWHKAKPEIFTIKKISDDQIRIWRTA